ncbi:hypothetical protein POTOM_002299 [Populus tomentosa]|uniref:Small EDRK-rich factor-like N-terminal domain-containing protein n=1 Tax=Populus tomentosa TaxID=118781 RepID=A0A8X8DJJ8_POPTO|nr:hypothetical protein POTOM_002299 [Populus tomentosa]
MGGGNGQKSKMARERNIEKQKAAKGSQLESNKKAMTVQSSLVVTVSLDTVAGSFQILIWRTMEAECSARRACRHSDAPQQR